ncbi:ABC transporter ATP-binding protein [Methyloversatilis universalis]|uniref:ABC transporter ATP-binding protein n=1 Tax=Methyloversatilis universalis TaxID=378211 RepID=UPI0003715D32|nr:ABC transporter ATP-binding protein [Methyloversatilis universalis]
MAGAPHAEEGCRMNAPLLEVRGLTAELDTPAGIARAVDALDLDLQAGETLALLGESGCGKSMTAAALMRLLPDVGYLAAGSVRLSGRELTGLTEAQMREARGRDMAMIFQEPGTSLNPVLTVMQQIGEVLAVHRGLRGAPARARARELLAAVGIPDAARRLDEYPFQFSGGMKQRVMIAMALAGEPKLLIADEPTTALDVTIQAQVLDVLAALQRERAMSMLLITHDLGVVARMAHQVGVMYAGQLIERAPRAAFFARPAHPYSQLLFAALPDTARRTGVATELATIPGSVPPLTTYFRGCRFADRCPRAWARCSEELPDWHDAGEAHRVRCHLHDPAEAARLAQQAGAEGARAAVAAAEAGEPLLEVRELKVHFPIRRGILQRTVGHVRAVDGVSLDIRAGRTLALVGESGCGKTTAGKALLKLIDATAGTITLGGVDLGRARGDQLRALRAQVQMVFQDPYGSLNPRMRVGEIIAEGMNTLGRPGDVAALLSQVGLRPDMADRYPHEFSGGQRQRIAIARALAVQPRLIVCDEPTSALDVSVQAQILNLLGRLQRELGLAYLFITHNIAVVEHLAHDVAVMYLGRIVESGPVDQVLRAPRHPYTRALLSAVPRIDGVMHAQKLAGDLPSPANPPSGCAFHPRCPKAGARCRSEMPPLEATGSGAGQRVACWFPEG